ncbi:MAG TPA: branched-chain amino acid transaminase [Candidatus Binatia bacterium]|nr:branched-chain amino acid transaminase [Candidatus Binatia bacterium]
MISDEERTEQNHKSAAVRPAGDGTELDIGSWAYFEGRLRPIEEARVSIATHALNYGTAVFEGIRAYRQHDGSLALLFAHEHYRRLLHNGRLLRASVNETPDELVEVTRELLRCNGHEGDVYIRPLLYKAALSIRLQLSDLVDRIAIFSFPLGDYVPTDGLRATISAWQRVNDNAIPARGKVSGSYVNACFATEDAHAAGYGEAILLAADGHVAEASAANLFVVHDGTVATPPLADDVLPGITRAAVIRIATDAGYEVEERKIDRTELYLADEVFLTGTGVQVAPVAQIDGRIVGSGDFPVVTDLQARYFAAVRGRDPRYHDWLTPV